MTILYVDKQGYLISCLNLQANKPHWLEAVEAAKTMYLDQGDQDIHSIYVRGSLAKGIAIDYVSDVDSFAVLIPKESESDHPNHATVKAWAVASEKKLIAQYPFYNRFGGQARVICRPKGQG